MSKCAAGTWCLQPQRVPTIPRNCTSPRAAVPGQQSVRILCISGFSDSISCQIANSLQMVFCGDFTIDFAINNTAGVDFISVYVLLKCVGLLAFEVFGNSCYLRHGFSAITFCHRLL